MLVGAFSSMSLALCAAGPGEERHDALGLVIDVPPRYTAVPVQPTESWVVLRYVGEAKGRRGVAPKLYVVKIDWSADPDPLPDPPPVTTFERYLEQRWNVWKVHAKKAGKAQEGWTVEEHDLALKELGEAASMTGWAHVQRSPGCSWIVLGFCAEEEAEKETRLWRRCAESLEYFEPKAPKDAAKWSKFYEKNPAFRNPELRQRLRARLIDGWEAEDTENYLLVYSTRKESLINHLAKRLESIRRAYAERFQPAAEITAVSTVRICKDQEEYGHYGGSSGTAGYWNPKSEELVLFVFENDDGWQSGKENSLLVMYHEAFHQYIHYAAGELAPHSWFNEGYGDYFGGARFSVQGKVGRVEPHPWRVKTIQSAARARAHPSWREIAWMPQQEFYAGDRSVHYAMAWSMIYFLNQSGRVKKNRAWAAILPTYYETLKAAHAREREHLASAGLAEDEKEVEKASTKARDEAASAAFHGVDMDAIEAAWREFTLELEEPK